MAARGRNLNVVVSREGSLSPRARSCSASPGRGGSHTFDEQVPQQVNYEDVILLHRKWKDAKRKVGVLQKEVSSLHGCLNNRGRKPSWEISYTTAKAKDKCKEFQEKMETAKRLLDASRLESAKLSRVLLLKTRKLAAARKEVARVPALTAEMARMLEDKSSAEGALGEQGRRAEEERRRSAAWRAQVDKLSLQSVQSAERCRALSNENGELKKDLERTRELLKEAKVRGVAAGGIADSLRLKNIEVGLLKEELGAVREDCGRLVQLVGSTKEYAQFRRLWDESEGLTCLNNRRTTSPFYAAMSGDGGDSEKPFGVSPSSIREERGLEATGAKAPFSGEGMHQLLRASGAVSGGVTAETTRAISWEQAMRSEWSSPAEKILHTVATVSPPLPPPPPIRASASYATPPQATAAAAAITPMVAGKERKAEQETNTSEGPEDRRGNTFTQEGWPAGDAAKTTRKVSFSQTGNASCRQALGPGKAQQVEGKSAASTQGCAAREAFPGASAEGSGGMGGDGSGGDGGRNGAAEVVRWGRVDLLSVVYPPLPAPPAREGSGKASGSEGKHDSGGDFSMWVPREAAALCRRFVRDFDGYSGVPLDVEQHRLLWRLLLGLNTTWRQSERKHVERLRTKYRVELAAVRRRLEMRKPMEVVVAERAAERRRQASASAYPGGPSAVVTATHNNTRRTREWGRDGRRLRPRDSSGRGSTSVGGNCGQSCSFGAASGKTSSAGRGKTAKAKSRGGKRGAVRAGRRGKEIGGAVPREAFSCAAEAQQRGLWISAAMETAGVVGEATAAIGANTVTSPSGEQNWRKTSEAKNEANFSEVWDNGDVSENDDDDGGDQFRATEGAPPERNIP